MFAITTSKLELKPSSNRRYRINCQKWRMMLVKELSELTQWGLPIFYIS